MILLWNSKVGPDDEVYHLGDLSLGSASITDQILSRLNGKKYLVWGNHDNGLRSKDRILRHFEWTKDYTVIKVQDDKAERGTQSIVLSHYPMLVWDKGHHGSWMLHGHSHGSLDELNLFTTRLDVGVDSHGYAPISYKEVKAIMATRTYIPVDHHIEEK